MGLGTIFYFIIGIILLMIFGRFLVWPIKKIFGLIINAILGGILLFLFNLIGAYFGMGIEINPLNAIIAGLLGVPGVVLILIFQLIF